ncbi:MAG: hypothetical protein ACRERE_05880 [Candidatus Entotheonellia bacterium]
MDAEPEGGRLSRRTLVLEVAAPSGAAPVSGLLALYGTETSYADGC